MESALCASELVRDGDLFSASDDLRVAAMQKMLALKQNGLLQEELNWQDISFIAENLYMSGHLRHHKLEEILDKSQPRREAVDSLIDAVIGNQSAVSTFMRILESENRFSYIAERISTEKGLSELTIIELIERIKPKPKPKLAIEQLIELIERIKPKPTIVVESKRIELVTIVLMTLNDTLNDTLTNRNDYTLKSEYPPAQKRMKMQESGSEALKEKMKVKSLRIAIAGQKLWSQVGKHLDLEFKEAYKRSFEDEE